MWTVSLMVDPPIHDSALKFETFVFDDISSLKPSSYTVNWAFLCCHISLPPLPPRAPVYAGGVPAVLLYGCESWCLTAESVRRLTNWHNKRMREMCRVTIK
jgi:hypothetical protein